MAPFDFGTTLVTGGAGLLGSHIIAALLQEPGCGPIVSVTRKVPKGGQSDVEYITCDLTDGPGLLNVFQEFKPKTVFHTASPSSTDFDSPVAEHLRENLGAAQNLLSAIGKVGTTRVLVFSSTVSVIESVGANMAVESTPYWKKLGGECLPYVWGKLQAEKLLLSSDTGEAREGEGSLRTCSMRLCLLYGPGDRTCVPELIDAVKSGKGNIQIGDNSNEIDVLSAKGAADAHLLAARALHDPSKASGKVGGEAFNVTDGKSYKFWDYMRIICRTAGDTTKPEDIKVIPAWLGMAMAHVAEGAYRVATLGRYRPKQLNTSIITHGTRTYTYEISKICKVLGYVPMPNVEQGIKGAVRADFERRGEPIPASALE